jgi:hypothetical protein
MLQPVVVRIPFEAVTTLTLHQYSRVFRLLSKSSAAMTTPGCTRALTAPKRTSGGFAESFFANVSTKTQPSTLAEALYDPTLKASLHVS